MKYIGATLILCAGLTVCWSCSPHRNKPAVPVSTDSASKTEESANTSRPVENKSIVDTLYLCVMVDTINLSEDSKLDVLITNATCSAIQYGDEHYLEYFERNEWTRMKPAVDNVALVWNTTGYELQPYMEEKRVYTINKKLYNFKTGKYRVVLPVSYNGKEKILTDSFHIVNDAI